MGAANRHAQSQKTPENLRDEGYTHLIWNLSLREGWDEPWAYVAYLDGTGKSVTDISQKIGRFLRQPNARPFDDGDLNSAYFYFNVPDEQFSQLLATTQSDLANDGHEIITITSTAARPKSSRESKLRKPVSIPKVVESFGEDLAALDQILLDNIPKFADEDLHAAGKVSTRVLDLRRNMEDGSLHKEEERDDNADIRVWDYLIHQLGSYDSRIAKKNSSCFSHYVKSDPRLQQRMQFGSAAMATVNRNRTAILKALNDELRLVYEPDQEYEIKPFNMVSPNMLSDDPKKRERYRVRKFNNSLHAEYNGLNAFEVQIASALDELGDDWCRNPSRTGYGIPIAQIGEGTTTFYPDFLLWTSKCLWAIDPKGAHLVNDAIYSKLMNVSDVDDLPTKIRVALILEGEHALTDNDRPQKLGSNGCTLIVKRNVGIRAKHFKSPQLLVKELKKG